MPQIWKTAQRHAAIATKSWSEHSTFQLTEEITKGYQTTNIGLMKISREQLLTTSLWTPVSIVQLHT